MIWKLLKGLSRGLIAKKTSAYQPVAASVSVPQDSNWKSPDSQHYLMEGTGPGLVWFGWFPFGSLVSAGLAWLVFGQVEFGIFAVTRGTEDTSQIWFGLASYYDRLFGFPSLFNWVNLSRASVLLQDRNWLSPDSRLSAQSE